MGGGGGMLSLTHMKRKVGGKSFSHAKVVFMR